MSDDETADRFRKVGDRDYEEVNSFLRSRTFLTAREWAVLRVSQDLRGDGMVPATRVGKELPNVVPFIDEEYSRQNVHNCRQQAYSKTQQAGITFAYAVMSDAFDDEETSDLLGEIVDGARYLLELEGGEMTFEEEQRAERQMKEVLREVRESAQAVVDESESGTDEDAT